MLSGLYLRVHTMFTGFKSFLVCRRLVELSTEVAAKWVKGRAFASLAPLEAKGFNKA